MSLFFMEISDILLIFFCCGDLNDFGFLIDVVIEFMWLGDWVDGLFGGYVGKIDLNWCWVSVWCVNNI